MFRCTYNRYTVYTVGLGGARKCALNLTSSPHSPPPTIAAQKPRVSSLSPRPSTSRPFTIYIMLETPVHPTATESCNNITKADCKLLLLLLSTTTTTTVYYYFYYYCLLLLLLFLFSFHSGSSTRWRTCICFAFPPGHHH